MYPAGLEFVLKGHHLLPVWVWAPCLSKGYYESQRIGPWKVLLGVFLTSESVEMPSNVHKAFGSSSAGVDTYLWEWQSMLLLLPPSSLNLGNSAVLDGTWENMGREVQKPWTWIRNSWVQLRIFQGWVMARVQSLQALIWREHKNPCQEAPPISHHILVKPQFLTQNIFILGVKNIIYVCSTILPKLKSSHYSVFICILLEDSYELMNWAISLLLWQNMRLDPTWGRNQYSSAYLFIQSSYSNLLEKTETLFWLCSSQHPPF